MNFDFIFLFKWILLASALMSAALALIGAQLAARDRSMQTLCVGQASSVGVLLGIGIASSCELGIFGEGILPLLAGGLSASIIYLVSDRLGAVLGASKNSYFCAMFVSLLSFGYLISVVFPALESHMAQVFFGDLATLSDQYGYVAIGIGFSIIVVNRIFWKSFTLASFNDAIFGEHILSAKNKATAVLFHACTVVALVFAIQELGFVFTVSSLFLPTILLRRCSTTRRHLALVAIFAFMTTLLGFVISLLSVSLPTVPTITCVMLAFGLLAKVSIFREKKGVLVS